MHIKNKMDRLTSLVSDMEIDAYLSSIADYNVIKTLFSDEKLGNYSLTSSFKIEFFHVINEDICLNDVGSLAKVGLSYLSSQPNTSVQLFKPTESNIKPTNISKSNTFMPIPFSINAAKNSYVKIDGTYVSPALYFSIDYINGTLNPKTKKVYKLYNIRTAVGLQQKFSYKSITNLDAEIERILYSVSPKITAYSFKESGNTIKLYNGSSQVSGVTSVAYDLDGNLKSYNTTDIPYSDTPFVQFIKDISNREYGKEFTNINGRTANMLSTNKIAIYSALLNFSKGELDNTTVYLKYLKSIYSNSILYSNWDEIRVLFEEFLTQVSKRTIHY